MSASIGQLKVLIHGIPLIFNGKFWTYPDNFPTCIDEYVQEYYFPSGEDQTYLKQTIDTVKFFFEHTSLRDLNSLKTWQYIDHHTPLRKRAEIILNEAAGTENIDWWIVECVPDKAWDEPLPPGMVD